MSGGNLYRRRRPSSLRWLAVVLVLIGAAALGVVAERAWQRSVAAARAESLSGEIATLRAELAASQEQVTELENRLAAVEARNPDGQIAALQVTVGAMRNEVAGLARQIAGGQAGSGDAPLQTELPPEVRLSVARQAQSHSLSCESAAASMAAHYHGLPLTEAEVLAALPRNDNPHLGFRGNVDGPTGSVEDYGVYAEPVAAVLNSRGLRAALVPDGLAGIKAALARGNPVVAWITYNCIVSTPVERDIAGQMVTLVPYQHAVVVTGYDGGGIWANDPYDGGEDYYATVDFERALGYFRHMAIEVAVH